MVSRFEIKTFSFIHNQMYNGNPLKLSSHECFRRTIGELSRGNFTLPQRRRTVINHSFTSHTRQPKKSIGIPHHQELQLSVQSTCCFRDNYTTYYNSIFPVKHGYNLINSTQSLKVISSSRIIRPNVSVLGVMSEMPFILNNSLDYTFINLYKLFKLSLWLFVLLHHVKQSTTQCMTFITYNS